MKLSKRRVLWVVGGCCTLALASLPFLGERIDMRPARNLQSAVEILRRSSFSRERNDRVPRDYETDIHPSCMNSWRIKLPSIGWYSDSPGFGSCWKSELYDQWNDDYYARFLVSRQESIPRAERYTQIMAVAGPDAPFTEFIEGRKQRVEDLPRDSILLIEVAQSNVHWMQAGDVTLSELDAAASEKQTLGIGVSSYGRWIAFSDGTVWLLDKLTPIAELLPFCTVEGAKKHDRERELRQYVFGIVSE